MDMAYLPIGVTMHRDALGVHFSADMCGDTRYSTAKAASAAYANARKSRRDAESTVIAAFPNLVIVAGATISIRQAGTITSTITLPSADIALRRARQIAGELDCHVWRS